MCVGACPACHLFEPPPPHTHSLFFLHPPPPRRLKLTRAAHRPSASRARPWKWADDTLSPRRKRPQSDQVAGVGAGVMAPCDRRLWSGLPPPAELTAQRTTGTLRVAGTRRALAGLGGHRGFEPLTLSSTHLGGLGPLPALLGDDDFDALDELHHERLVLRRRHIPAAHAHEHAHDHTRANSAPWDAADTDSAGQAGAAVGQGAGNGKARAWATAAASRPRGTGQAGRTLNARRHRCRRRRRRRRTRTMTRTRRRPGLR